MKFIHAADIHLGRQFSGLNRSSPSLAQLFLRSGYSAWDRIVARAIDLKVDFMTLGGDIFDASNPSVRPRVAFREGVGRLSQAGIPVYAVLGNHDPLRTFPDSLRSLPGLYLFGPEPETKEITPGALIHGVSYESSVEKTNLARKIHRRAGAELAIGLLHADVGGNKDHGHYAPCTLDDLMAAGMDVWCLGHVHSPSVLLEEPLILYSGSAQGAHVNEPGPRGCHVVSIEGSGPASREFLPIAPVRWETVDLDITHCSCPEDALDSAEEVCSDLVSKLSDLEAIVARVRLRGRPSSPGLAGLTGDVDFLSLLSERLERLPIPVFPGDFIDCVSIAEEHELSLENGGFLADLLRIAGESAEDVDLRRDLVERISADLSKINRKYYENSFDSECWKQNPGVVEERVNQAAELVLRMFLEPGM